MRPRAPRYAGCTRSAEPQGHTNSVAGEPIAKTKEPVPRDRLLRPILNQLPNGEPSAVSYPTVSYPTVSYLTVSYPGSAILDECSTPPPLPGTSGAADAVVSGS